MTVPHSSSTGPHGLRPAGTTSRTSTPPSWAGSPPSRRWPAPGSSRRRSTRRSSEHRHAGRRRQHRRIVALRAGIRRKGRHSVCATAPRDRVGRPGRRLIQTGEADVVLAGTENMSRSVPLREKVKAVFTKAGMSKTAKDRIGPGRDAVGRADEPVIGLKEGLTDPVCGLNMGRRRSPREGGLDQPRNAGRICAEVHLRRRRAGEAGRGDRAGPDSADFDRVATADNGIRENQTMEALAKLKPSSTGSSAPSRPETRRRSPTARRRSSSRRRSS